MKIEAIDAGKRFNREWIFRHFSYTFHSGNAYAVTGPNGSGKSTLLQVIAGALMTSQGVVNYFPGNKLQPIDGDTMYQHISIAAPYLDLIEEMTAEEFLSFHHRFKPLLEFITIPQILTEVGLEKAIHKQIRLYSSGMKQRLKLAQAFYTDTPALFLDEPCTNLDKEGIELYHQLVQRFVNERLVVICSNDPEEYGICKNLINVMDFKGREL